ncbi:hypothetical protein [Yinghuangia soli]|uniref:Uncharacterized protein n=1 Tax=Yinghuangia soli TaxID=2908204 RepID=A0AA41U4D2_9ACTN|nr:hypothetical protein [Yinghuangia soli]MCF2530687.1 hypothetical protein [Yinghuangia soli]
MSHTTGASPAPAPAPAPAPGPPGRRSRWGRTAAGLAGAIAVSVAAQFAVDALTGSSDDPPARTQPAASGASGTPGPPPEKPTRENPWAGSKAAAYGDGLDGIPVPEVRELPGYSKEAVQRAVDTTRFLLAAGNLDAAVLRGEAPATYLQMIDHEHADMRARLEQALAAPDGEHDPLAWVTRFDPDEVEVVSATAKTTGTMSVALDADGILVVHVEADFVYAVAPVDGKRDRIDRSMVRRALDVSFLAGGALETPVGKVFLSSTDVVVFNTSCDRDDGFIHPLVAASPGGSLTGPTMDPYATPGAAVPTGAVSQEGGCFPTALI